jgi:hypothetical protein
MCCQPYELDRTSIEKRAGADEKGIGSVLRQTCEGGIDLTRRARGKVSAELAARGHLNERGVPFSAASIASMLG